jgi:hypothetical protein
VVAGIAPAGERRVVRQVSVISAVRVSLAMGLSLSAIMIVGVVALYVLGQASGALGSAESFIESLWPDFSLNLFTVVFVLLLLSLGFCGVLAATAAVLCVLYNVLADLVGGVEITTRER